MGSDEGGIPTLQEDLTYLGEVAKGLKECEQKQAAANKVPSSVTVSSTVNRSVFADLQALQGSAHLNTWR